MCTVRTTSCSKFPACPPRGRGLPGRLIDGRRHGVEGCGLQLGGMWGCGYPPEVRLLDWLVRVIQEQGNPSSPAHRAAHRGVAHDGAKGYLVRLRHVPVPGDIDADVRLGQAEVGAVGFTRLHLPEVARRDIVATGRRGMLRQEPQVSVEVGSPVRVVPNPVAMALEPLAAQVLGTQRLHGVEERLVVQAHFSEISCEGPWMRRCTSLHCSGVGLRF